MLKAEPLENNIAIFRELRGSFPVEACEIHSESTLYESACHIGNPVELRLISVLRQDVRKLGIHLPFMDLHPVSGDNQTRETTMRIFYEWMKYAGDIEADYAVLHLRDNLVNNGIWLPFIDELAEIASKYKFDLCIENADDVRDFNLITDLADKSTNPVKICLDLGHLYERIYPSSPTMRRILRLNDLFSPFPFTIGKNLPAKTHDGWHEILESSKTKLGSVHIHNHNGRMAHKPLSKGKINFKYLENFRETLKNIPVILEADYRFLDHDIIVKDLKYLEGIIENEK